jgi:hypothetical protein
VSAGSISGAADSFSGLSLGKEDDSSPMKNSTVQSTAALIECKCGMPLCICEAPKPEPSPTPVKVDAIHFLPTLVEISILNPMTLCNRISTPFPQPHSQIQGQRSLLTLNRRLQLLPVATQGWLILAFHNIFGHISYLYLLVLLDMFMPLWYMTIFSSNNWNHILAICFPVLSLVHMQQGD